MPLHAERSVGSLLQRILPCRSSTLAAAGCQPSLSGQRAGQVQYVVPSLIVIAERKRTPDRSPCAGGEGYRQAAAAADFSLPPSGLLSPLHPFPAVTPAEVLQLQLPQGFTACADCVSSVGGGSLVWHLRPLGSMTIPGDRSQTHVTHIGHPVSSA